MTDDADARLSINVAGEIIAFDEGAEAMFGHRRDDVIGQPMAELIIPEPLRQAHHDGMARFLRTREPFLIGGPSVTLTALHADGRVFPAELTLSLESEDPVVITANVKELDES